MFEQFWMKDKAINLVLESRYQRNQKKELNKLEKWLKRKKQISLQNSNFPMMRMVFGPWILTVR